MKAPILYQFASKEKLSQLENEFENEKRLVLIVNSYRECNSVKQMQTSVLKFDVTYFRQLIDDLISHPNVFTFDICPSACLIQVFVNQDLQLFDNDILKLYRDFIKII